MYLALLLPLVVCTGYLACAQPICRDLLAPFEYSEAAYCPEYGGFGCCGKRSERKADKWAADAQLRLKTAEEKEVCSEYTRNVSCLTCSPFAGRIFHSDDPENETIPLCYDYCVETYIKCRFSLLRMFKLHPWRQGLVSKFPSSEEAMENDAATFCKRYASDPPYCYPEVEKLEDQFSSPPPADQTDCVCLTPVASGLRQPLAIVGAGDATDRLFIMEQTGIVRILEERRTRPNGPKISVLVEEPFLNITSTLMVHRVDDGLLNMVFHPQFRQNGRLFIYYVYRLVRNFNNTDTDLLSMNVSEFRVSRDNPNTVDYDSQRLIFSLPYVSLHEDIPELTGGGFFFKDEYLYLAIGEREVVEGDGTTARNL